MAHILIFYMFTSLKRITVVFTDEASVAVSVVWPISFLFNMLTDLKGYQFFLLLLFAITAAGVVSYGGHKMSPRISSIVNDPLRSVRIFLSN